MKKVICDVGSGRGHGIRVNAMFQCGRSWRRANPFVAGAWVWIALALILPMPVLAHSAVVWAEVRDDRVEVEAYFSNGGKVKDARIVVLDADHNQLAEGTTDESGRFTFYPTQKTDMIIRLIVDDQHLSEFVFGTEESGEALPTPKAE